MFVSFGCPPKLTKVRPYYVFFIQIINGIYTLAVCWQTPPGGPKLTNVPCPAPLKSGGLKLRERFCKFFANSRIVAVFVETTNAAARSTNDALDHARDSESFRLASRLKELIRVVYSSLKIDIYPSGHFSQLLPLSGKGSSRARRDFVLYALGPRFRFGTL